MGHSLILLFFATSMREGKAKVKDGRRGLTTLYDRHA
jgi:hypothetical protein